MNKMATFLRESGPARFLIPVGIMLIIFGIITFIITANSQEYIEAEATVYKVEIDEEEHNEGEDHVDATYTLYIQYKANKKVYKSELNGMSKYKKGEKLTIYYNPKKPTEVTTTKSLILPIIITVGGVAALVGGIISANNAIKKHKNMKKQEEEWKDGK